MNAEQSLIVEKTDERNDLADRYLRLVGAIPKAPPAMMVEMLNAGAWGTLPVPMNVSRARRFDLETVRPARLHTEQEAA